MTRGGPAEKPGRKPKALGSMRLRIISTHFSVLPALVCVCFSDWGHSGDSLWLRPLVNDYDQERENHVTAAAAAAVLAYLFPDQAIIIPFLCYVKSNVLPIS